MKQLSMYINGRFETDFNGTWRDVLNPATEEVIAREPKGGKADVDRAVAAARDAQTAWERLPAVERGAYLRKIAQGIRERADELTDTIVAEGGKTKDIVQTSFGRNRRHFAVEFPLLPDRPQNGPGFGNR